MEWLVLAGLGFWLVVLASRLSTASAVVKRQGDQLAFLTAEVLALRRGDSGAAAVPLPVASPTPVQPSSPTASPELRAADTAVPPSPSPSQPPAPTVAPAPSFPLPAPPPKPARPSVQIDRWLAEKGLAWIGGGALVLGAAFLVGYAVQQGVFTPERRVGAGAALGLLLLAASEALRRAGPLSRLHHPLAAAVCAGAGAAALYAAIWAGHGLYGLIDAAAAAASLAAVSGLLLALSFRHGEPLAGLAIFGAFVAPIATGVDVWASAALSLYLGGVVLAGFGVARARRWAGVAAATAIGGLAWAWLGIAEGGLWRAAALMGLTVGACVATFVLTRARDDDPAPWSRARRDLTGVAIVGGAVTAWLIWAGGQATPDTAPGGVALLTVIALAALAAWFGAAPGLVMAAPAMAAAAAASLSLTSGAGAQAAVAAWSLSWTVVLIAAAALVGRRTGDARSDAAAAAAALFTAGVLGWTLSGVDVAASWAAPCAVALAALAAGSLRNDRSTGGAASEDLWGAAAAGALLVAAAAAFAPIGEAPAFAAAAGAFAMLGRGLGWRVWTGAGLVAAALALGALFQSGVFGLAVAGGLPLSSVAGATFGTATVLFAAAWAFRRWGAPIDGWQGVLTAATVAGLTGAFLVIRRLA